MKKGVVLFACFLLIGCAELHQYMVDNYCNYEGAYTLGSNDASADRPMSIHQTSSCPEESKSKAQQGYREGYAMAQKNKLSGTKLNINIGASPAGKPECHSQFGSQVCGYNCIQSYGKWYCANQPNEFCIENYAKVKCGINCRANFGDIICDR